MFQPNMYNPNLLTGSMRQTMQAGTPQNTWSVIYTGNNQKSGGKSMELLFKETNRHHHQTQQVLLKRSTGLRTLLGQPVKPGWSLGLDNNNLSMLIS
jgi:hypothetical protein